MIYEPWERWPWLRLKSAPAAIIEEANCFLEATRGFMFPAPRKDVVTWMAALGACVAGQMPADDVKMKLKVYADLNQQPAFCFTKDTLRAAARKFQWFPSYAELDAFLEGQGEEYRRMHYRLLHIIALQTDEEIAAAKAADDAAKLERMLSTPSGRIRHRHHERFWRSRLGVSAAAQGWWNLVDILLETHPEEIVDRWHTEVAALDWNTPGYDPLEDLLARSRAQLHGLDPRSPEVQ